MFEAISPNDLVQTTPGDVFVRAAVLGGSVGARAWLGDGAVAWCRSHPDRAMLRLSGAGSPAGAAALLSELAGELPEELRVSLPRGWTEHLPPGVAVDTPSHWDWMWTADAPTPQPGEDLVRWLGADDDDDIEALLREVSPGASTWPGDAHARAWAGLRTPAGRLAAVLAETGRSPAVGHLSSVATALDLRGHGYGAAVTGWATRRLLEAGAEVVTLGMHAENDTAGRLYRRLGFRCDHRFTGGRVTRTDPGDDR